VQKNGFDEMDQRVKNSVTIYGRRRKQNV